MSAGFDSSKGSYRRVIRTIHASTKRDAKAALAELEVEVRSGRVGPADVTLAELLDRWMDHIAAKGRSQNTLYGYRRYIDREINPVLGSTKLSKLTSLNVDRFYDSLIHRGLAPATVRQAHAILRASLNQAEKWGLVGRNVAKLATPPAQPQREQQPPSVDDVRLLIETATEIDPAFAAYVRLVAATGMRRAEACAVRWGDLDLEARTLVVGRSHVAIPGFRDDQSTKTRSTRTVNLDVTTIAILTNIKRAQPKVLTMNESCVFTNDGNQPWRPDYASKRWAQLREQAGVNPSVRLHDLRHWQATQLLDGDVGLPTVASRLGHASGTTTMKVYAHGTPEADRRASEIIGDILDGT